MLLTFLSSSDMDGWMQSGEVRRGLTSPRFWEL